MAQIKDEAFYEAQQREAEQALAQMRRERLAPALAALDDLSARLPHLMAVRDALPPESPARAMLGNVVSILTSAPGVVRNEIAALQSRALAAEFSPVTWTESPKEPEA